MKKLLLIAIAALALAAPARAASISDSLDCAIFYDTVTLADIAGARVDVVLSHALEAGCVATPEGSVDGNVWVTVPLKKNNAGSNVYALTRTNTLSSVNWTFRNSTSTDYNHFRLRISAFGGMPGFNLTTLTTVP